MRDGTVFDLRRHSTHDGPGLRTTVFLKGCALRCPWCHNPEGLDPRPELLFRLTRCLDCGSCLAACPLGLDPRAVAPGGPGRAFYGPPEACAACPSFGACAEACPAEALQSIGRRMGVAEVLAEVAADTPFYEASGGGATFSGGEPLLQAEFLLECLEACAAAGIGTAVETSALAPRGAFLAVAARADLLLVDLKLADPERHAALTGSHNAPIVGNLRAAAKAWAAGGSAALAYRLPLVPGLNDRLSDLEAAAELIASLPAPHGTCAEVHLLPYHDSARGKYAVRGLPFPLPELRPARAQEHEGALRVFEARGLRARLGG
jgi:pyruvate formate lyase activating enzyme